MIIKDLRLPVNHTQEQLEKRIQKQSGLCNPTWKLLRRSIDARQDPVCYTYTIEAAAKGEAFSPAPVLEIPRSALQKRPIIVGSGPAGLFAAWILAKSGACPLLLERENRWRSGKRILSIFRKPVC